MRRSASVAIILLAALPTTSSGIGRILKAPSVSQNASLPNTIDKVMPVLTSPRYQFVTGHYINWNTELYYSGTASQFSAFYKGLLLASPQSVSLRFSAEKGRTKPAFGEGGGVQCDWHVRHNGTSDSYSVTLFISGGRVKIDELEFTTIRPVKESSKEAASSNDFLKHLQRQSDDHRNPTEQ